MSEAKPEPELFTIFRNMRERYSHLVDFDDERFSYMPGDMAELLGDLDEVYPALARIAREHADDKQFVAATNDLEARLWHIIQHAESLRKSIEAWQEVRMAALCALDEASDEASEE